ncbi:MAG TPA: hypothetical protein VGH34_19260 [Vicinamibacterales bacterium]
MLSRWPAVVIGAVTFLAAHAIEVAGWTTLFHGTRAPWFLNSSAAIAFTLAAVFAVSCLIVPSGLSAGQSRGLGFGLGATIAMTVVLLAGPGPGTIFPIVIVFGATILVLASVAGAWLGRQVAKWLGKA